MFYCDKGIWVRAGCFFDTVKKFSAAVEETHGKSEHGDHYRAALKLVVAMKPKNTVTEEETAE